jgi:hypothetical protein
LGILKDAQVFGRDHFDNNKIFTLNTRNWSNLTFYFDELHRNGLKAVLILDSAVAVNDSTYPPYRDGLSKQVFIKWPPGKSPDSTETGSDIMIGYVSIKATLYLLYCVLKIKETL